MHFNILFLAAALSTGVLAQQTRCSELDSGFGYVCGAGGREVRYCQPDKTPRRVVSQYCGSNDCRANGSQGMASEYCRVQAFDMI